MSKGTQLCNLEENRVMFLNMLRCVYLEVNVSTEIFVVQLRLGLSLFLKDLLTDKTTGHRLPSSVWFI